MNDLVETIDCIRIDIKTLTQKKEVVATESKLALYVNDEFVYEFLYSHGFNDINHNIFTNNSKRYRIKKEK